MFYLKLAWNNLRHSLRSYFPFLLASLLLFSLTCSTLLILFNPMAKDMGTAVVIIGLGVVVLTLFSVIMERYSYKILLKQRSREFGLYNMLGMTKAQVHLIANLELLIIFGLLCVIGSIISAVLAKFIYLIFVNITTYDQLNLKLVPVAFIWNIIIFALIFGLLALSAGWHIRKTSPLALFRSPEQGEREPRGNGLLALLGLVCLAVGYSISLTSGKMGALAIIFLFFLAVLFVIAGTYLFYISFISWYLKRRRKNKAYYYQAEHFVSTSQMIFRMKQNAVGLASISLLVVMALVTIGTTVTLYQNTQNLVGDQFIKNTRIAYTTDEESSQKLLQKDVLDKLGKSPKDALSYTTSVISLNFNQDTKAITVNQANVSKMSLADTGFVYLISQKDFRKLGNQIPHLKAGQAIFASQKGKSQLQSLNLFGQSYEVVKNLKQVNFPQLNSTYNAAILVLPNKASMQAIYQAYQPYLTKITSLTETYTTYLDLTPKEVAKIQTAQGQVGSGDLAGELAQRSVFLEDGYKIFGGFLFTGVLLGFSFLLGMVLIIYYKQYSEGQEDKKSYHILQEVGMSAKQVKRTINTQILLLFFMPLALASLHFLVAIPMLKHMLRFFGVVDANIVYLVCGLTVALIALIYYLVYRLTSRTYYRIIER